MSARKLERLRTPVALVLLLILGMVAWPRAAASPAAGNPSPPRGVVAGEPGGEVVAATTSPTPHSPIPAATAPGTPAPTTAPTEEPPARAADGFSADVLACRSISGTTCNGQLGTLPPTAASFTALVRFSDAGAGDQLNAVLDGPSGTIAGSPYALQGGGDGYFWAEFQVGGLPGGEYVVTALRNGEEVATTGFVKEG